VMVVTCTDGGAGSILNPAMDKPDVLENIIEVRREEMANAAKILGIQHRWLGFKDSGLPEGDPLPPLPEGCFALVPLEESVPSLVEAIRDFRPHVVVTYDENGGYPHPDHIRTHEISMAALDAAADASYQPELGEAWETQKVYYGHGFSRAKILAFHEAMESRGMESPYAEWLANWNSDRPDVMDRVTTQVECAEYFDVRDEALKAHATQIDPTSRWFGIPMDLQREIWPTEEYELVRSQVDSTLPENDLFAGVKV
jgi:mycothiol S-conjugate amidase